MLRFGPHQAGQPHQVATQLWPAALVRSPNRRMVHTNRHHHRPRPRAPSGNYRVAAVVEVRRRHRVQICRSAAPHQNTVLVHLVTRQNVSQPNRVGLVRVWQQQPEPVPGISAHPRIPLLAPRPVALQQRPGRVIKIRPSPLRVVPWMKAPFPVQRRHRQPVLLQVEGRYTRWLVASHTRHNLCKKRGGRNCSHCDNQPHDNPVNSFYSGQYAALRLAR